MATVTTDHLGVGHLIQGGRAGRRLVPGDQAERQQFERRSCLPVAG
jgi:hypothetical protein